MIPVRILVVDDSPENLRLARHLLQREGYAVSTACSAERALAAILKSPPRLVLTDVRLPGMDGLGLAARIKSDPLLRHILVVAVTAGGSGTDRDQAWDSGCDGYILKPIDTRSLPRTIARLLARNPAKTRRLAEKP